jgi:type II secretory pathway predicted ATPase ExeA
VEVKSKYKQFFGFEKEPFSADIAIKEIMQTNELSAAKNRFEYATDLGAVYLLTGEIGSGKSTTIRYLLRVRKILTVTFNRWTNGIIPIPVKAVSF